MVVEETDDGGSIVPGVVSMLVDVSETNNAGSIYFEHQSVASVQKR